MFWQPKADKAIDGLLRSGMARQGGRSKDCQGFDPDLTAAYIEKSLTKAEIARYELHLSACAVCRREYIEFIRFSDAAPVNAPAKALPAIIPPATEPKPFWSIFGHGQIEPQWAIATLALLILAISIPLLISSIRDKQADLGQIAKSTDSTQESSAITAPRAGGLQTGSGLSESVTHKVRPIASGELRTPVSSSTTPKDKSSASAPGPASPPNPESQPAARTEDSSQPSETGAASSDKKEATKEAEVKAAPETIARADRPSRRELPKLDSSKALKLPDTESRASNVNVLKKGRVGSGVDDEPVKTGTIKPQDTVASRRSRSSSEGADRPGISSPALGISLIKSDEKEKADSRGASERKVAGKRFWLISGVWTDRDYKSTSLLPIVRLVYNSESYKQLLSKEAGLKTILEAFSPEESALIVHRSNVYIIKPADKKQEN